MVKLAKILLCTVPFTVAIVISMNVVSDNPGINYTNSCGKTCRYLGCCSGG